MMDKLTDPSQAYAYAGFDQDFTFFKTYTKKLRDPKTGEVGMYEVPYQNYFPALEASADPVGFLKLAARIIINNNVKTTGVPIEQWIVEFSPLMEKFGIPSHLYLDRPRDRAWLA